MLQLHFYSNHAGRLVLNNESHDWWSFDTYPVEIIKEFEQISQAWKTFLADSLRRGLMVLELEELISIRIFSPISTNYFHLLFSLFFL